MDTGDIFRLGGRSARAFLITSLLLVTLITGGSAMASGSTWTLAHSANLTLPGGRLDAVSCSAPDACTAVGTDLNARGINVTLAERWNGTAWSRQSTPNPAQDTVPSVSPDLHGVSCPTAGFCVAVGSYQLVFTEVSMAMTWNGSAWTSQTFPIPAGASSERLNGVSCISASSCEAVGSYEDSLGITVTLAAAWDGTSWQIQQTPNPAGFTLAPSLNGISCSIPTSCEAVGGDDQVGLTFAERWNGSSWQLQTVPGTAGLQSVSCASPGFCEAIGPNGVDGWSGSAWTAQTLPASIGGVAGVACTSAAFCEVVGENNTGSVVATATTWNGNAWQAQAIPNPATSTFTQSQAVACPKASSCEAVGYFKVNVTSSNPKPFAEGWDGESWLLQHPVAPAQSTDNILSAVSCTSPSFCEAVGEAVNSSGNQVFLAEAWDGTSWRIHTTPMPMGQFGPATGELFGVSCTSPSFCMAVGAGPNGAAAEMWNGTAWTFQSRPGTTVQPDSVSCVSPTFCMSVNGFGQTDVWNGSAWSSVASVPGFSAVGSVSCVSASFCEVVGGGPAGQNAAVWDGSSWTLQPTPGPTSAAPDAVSCVNATSCEAVGSYVTASFQEAPFAMSWDGTSWTAQTIPAPTGSNGSALLRSVSCASATSCTAAGDFQYGSLDQFRTLGEVWDGTSWTIAATVDVPNAGGDHLNGVSCGAVQTCTAAGSTSGVGSNTQTLIETGN